MYGIKRNVKIGNKVVSVQNKVEPIVAKELRRLKSNGLGKYKFPTYDEVPSGTYYSKIVKVQDSNTRAGIYAIEVMYEIRDAIICYKIANKMMVDDGKSGIYYIRQKYPEDTVYYNQFVDAMYKALDKEDEEINFCELEGVTEQIKLSYDKSNYGGYSERTPIEFIDYIDPRLEQNNSID